MRALLFSAYNGLVLDEASGSFAVLGLLAPS
jgi:hypothetical protein